MWTDPLDPDGVRSRIQRVHRRPCVAVIVSVLLLAIFPTRSGAQYRDSSAVYVRSDHESARNVVSEMPIKTAPERLPVPLRMFRHDFAKPTAFVLGWEAIGLTWLLALDAEATGFEEPSLRNFVRAVTTPPGIDQDRWYTNYLGHPMWGSETYLAVRRDGYSPMKSFLYSTAHSVLWEVGIEGWVEHPSIQDLLLTSTIGSVLGEVRYLALRSLCRRNSTTADILILFIDPFRSVTNLVGFRIDIGIAVAGLPSRLSE
jgi:hypothetical protein